MPTPRRLIALVPALVLPLLPATALAQAATDQTGTGGGPASTVTAPNTNSLGVTKPPGASVAPQADADRERREQRERAMYERISRSICRGC